MGESFQDFGADLSMHECKQVFVQNVEIDSVFFLNCECELVLSCEFCTKGTQWLNGRVLDSGPRGGRFEPHQRHCLVSLSKTHYS